MSIDFTKLKIVHYTREENLQSIIDMYAIADQLHRPATAVNGEGGTGRVFADYKCTDFRNVHEAFGIYFRIYCTDDVYKIPQNEGFRAIVLKQDALQHFDWHLNCTENNGFYIFDSFAPYSGYDDVNAMKTYEKDNIHLLDYNELSSFYDPELVIRADHVSLDFVEWIM